MLKIRLTRMGAKKNPFYRVVVIDSKEARNGTPVATVGWYDPAKADALSSLMKKQSFPGLAKVHSRLIQSAAFSVKMASWQSLLKRRNKGGAL